MKIFVIKIDRIRKARDKNILVAIITHFFIILWPFDQGSLTGSKPCYLRQMLCFSINCIHYY